jgi:molybdopterin-guanine dinucleotide biosynthesis protein
VLCICPCNRWVESGNASASRFLQWQDDFGKENKTVQLFGFSANHPSNIFLKHIKVIYTSMNILLVSGSGRNVGKTSFIRRVIAHNVQQKVIAIKITPHFHEPTAGLIPIVVTENYRIFQETAYFSGKDSSLFLQAGAEKVFYIQTTDKYLKEAFELAVSSVQQEQPVIVESAAFRTVIVPELYVFIHNQFEEMKPSAITFQKMADVIIYSDSGQFSMDPATIIFDQTWKITTNDHT